MFLRTLLVALSVVILSTGCMSMRKEQDHYIVPDIDIDQTLKVAEDELNRDGFGRVLTIWAIRDQHITPEQADRVADLYFEYIDTLEDEFEIWHLTWAVSNIYRQGPPKVRQVLSGAYTDATRRAAVLSDVADTHANGERLYRGDVHVFGRGYARSHIVAPGNDRYLQSYQEYAAEQENSAEKPEDS